MFFSLKITALLPNKVPFKAGIGMFWVWENMPIREIFLPKSVYYAHKANKKQKDIFFCVIYLKEKSKQFPIRKLFTFISNKLWCFVGAEVVSKIWIVKNSCILKLAFMTIQVLALWTKWATCPAKLMMALLWWIAITLEVSALSP